jgi:hypothetical protein
VARAGFAPQTRGGHPCVPTPLGAQNERGRVSPRAKRTHVRGRRRRKRAGDDLVSGAGALLLLTATARGLRESGCYSPPSVPELVPTRHRGRGSGRRRVKPPTLVAVEGSEPRRSSSATATTREGSRRPRCTGLADRCSCGKPCGGAAKGRAGNGLATSGWHQPWCGLALGALRGPPAARARRRRRRCPLLADIRMPAGCLSRPGFSRRRHRPGPSVRRPPPSRQDSETAGNLPERRGSAGHSRADSSHIRHGLSTTESE